ncbi:hypothetical protein GCM10028796_41750 [Ramlibacter monticola]
MHLPPHETPVQAARLPKITGAPLLVLAGLLATAILPAHAATPVALAPGEYELTTETVLPHLEEALRYATTRTRQCLQAPDATELFPLLRHQAFAGCALVSDAKASDGLHYALQCRNPEAATGSAVFELDGSRLSAVLELKMGGKNMTLSQRLHGPRLGPCPR